MFILRCFFFRFANVLACKTFFSNSASSWIFTLAPRSDSRLPLPPACGNHQRRLRRLLLFLLTTRKQDSTTLSESTTLSNPASALTKLSLRNIFDNLTSWHTTPYSLSLSFSILSLVIFRGTQLFLSTYSNVPQADLSKEGETIQAPTHS